MEPVTALLGGALGLGALGSIGGGIMGGKSNKAAMDFQKGSFMNSAGLQNYLLNLQQMSNSPYEQAGYGALPQLQYLITGQRPDVQWSDADSARYGDLSSRELAIRADREMYGRSYKKKYGKKVLELDKELTDLASLKQRKSMYDAVQGMGDDIITASPGYTWQQEQGERALNRQTAARGMYGSRAALNSLGDFNRALGAEEFNSQIGRLSSMVNMGRGATAETNAGMQGVGNALTSVYQNGANAMGNLASQRGQIYGNMAGQLGALPMQGLGLYAMGGGKFGGGGLGGTGSGADQWYGQGNPFTIGQ